MDGRDFGPPRSVHGPPPPLLSGLAMDSHRVGTAAAGRLPASGLPGPLPPGKYMAGLNLHPHPGKCPAPWPPPPGTLGREARGKPTRPVPGRSRQGRGTSLPLGRATGVRVGSAPRAGGPPGAAERGARLGCFPRRASALSEHTHLPKPEAGSNSDPGAPAAPAQAGVFKIWARKEASPTPFETSVPRASIVFLANALARRRRWAPVRSWLLRSHRAGWGWGGSGRPQSRGCGEDGHLGVPGTPSLAAREESTCPGT